MPAPPPYTSGVPSPKPRRASSTARAASSHRSSAARPAAGNDAPDNVTRVYTELRSLIISGQLPPGARIAERAVVARMGLSRTPIRSALHRLQQEGLVASVGRAGDQRLIVTPLTRGDGREVFSIVGHLEGLAASEAASLPTEQRRQARRPPARGQPRARRRREDQGVAGAAVRSRPQFHATYVEGVAGPRVVALHRAIKPQSERYARLYVNVLLDELPTSVKEHESITAAIAKGDRRGAQHAVETNWQNAAVRLSDVIAEHGERGSWHLWDGDGGADGNGARPSDRRSVVDVVVPAALRVARAGIPKLYTTAPFARPPFASGDRMLRRLVPLAARRRPSRRLPASPRKGTRLLRHPAINGNAIAFEYGGDLWVTTRAGGPRAGSRPRPTSRRDPHFSPDGSHIAFSRTSAATPTSTSCRRPAASRTDSRSIRESTACADGRPTASASSSPVGPRERAAILVSPAVHRSRRRRLRGAAADAARVHRHVFARRNARRLRRNLDGVHARLVRDEHVAPLSRRPHAPDPHHGSRDYSVEKLPWKNSNDSDPMWIGNTVYFLSDRNYTRTSSPTTSRRRSSKQLTHHDDFDIMTRRPDPTRSSTSRTAYIHLFDIKTGQIASSSRSTSSATSRGRARSSSASRA